MKITKVFQSILKIETSFRKYISEYKESIS